MLGYLTIFATAVLGYLGAPWWTLLGGAAVLSALAAFDLRPFRSRLSTIGALYLVEQAVYARMAHSALAAVAAFAWGALIRLAISP